jgi:hypothetical protein
VKDRHHGRPIKLFLLNEIALKQTYLFFCFGMSDFSMSGMEFVGILDARSCQCDCSWFIAGMFGCPFCSLVTVSL